MKKIITISVILIAVILFGVFELMHIGASFTYMADRLELARTAVEELDYAESIAIIEEVEERWETYRALNYMLVNHNMLNTTYVAILTAATYLETESDTDALAALDTAITYCRHLATDAFPLMQNIF